MARPQLPPIESIVGDLLTDRVRVRTLVAGSGALFAAGLDPRIWSPQLTTVQAAVRAQPDLDAVILLNGLAAAMVLLVGGAIGDLSRARPLIRGGLVVLLCTALIGLLLPDTAVFSGARIVSNLAASIVFPVALASIAIAYTGMARATAIGIGYAAYGAGQALMPVLLTVVPSSYLPGFAAEVVAVLVALRLAWGSAFELPHPRPAERPYIVGTALWASGIVALATGVLWLGAGPTNPIRLGIIALGLLLLGGYLLVERRRRLEQPERVRVERRPVTVALFAGLVIAIAQNIPMAQLPNYFAVIMGYGPLFGIVAVAPLFVALIVAGPIAGYLLARVSPRTLVGGGIAAVGAGNLAMAAILGRDASYIGFVLPLVVIGGGFVIATTVRTAIIFASVPRGLPATAAAMNEASIQVGARAGILVSTAIIGQVGLSTLDAALAQSGIGADAAAAQHDQFAGLLAVFGTPAFASLVSAVHPDDIAGYADAYVAGVRAALVLGGVAAVLGGALAWAVLGRRDPLTSVYEHRDERLPADGAA
jgi:MFS family permease